MTRTAIQWTDRVWNPVTGCTKVSKGCLHCYAETWAGRQMGPWKGRRFEDVTLHHDRIDQPLRWRNPARVFVNSMSDLFHDDVPDTFILATLAVMQAAPLHTFQVLTKRPERARSLLRFLESQGGIQAFVRSDAGRSDLRWHFNDVMRTQVNKRGAKERAKGDPWAWVCNCAAVGGSGSLGLPNLHLGVSVEDQQAADERIPILLDTPAAVRWISAEPLLGPVDLGHAAGLPVYREAETVTDRAMPSGDTVVRPGRGWCRHDGNLHPWLDWVVVGGESGPGARHCHVDWIRSLVEQCAAADVPAFVKQLGARCRENQHGTHNVPMWHGSRGGQHWRGTGSPDGYRHAKGGDLDEWPEDLRVQEFPR